MIEIKRYTEKDQEQWDQLVRESCNGTFLFLRGYMDYHQERFNDHSLLFYIKGKLCALMPANEKEKTLYSHQGLTYGGIIHLKELKSTDFLDIFNLLTEYLKVNLFNTFRCKLVPEIYHTYPCAVVRYAMFKHQARVVACGLSTAIPVNENIPFTTLRKRGINKAIKEQITIERELDFTSYWQLLSNVLDNRHHTVPVHTAEEMTRLSSLFPDNIQLIVAKEQKEIIAGCVLYKTAKVDHVQYIAASEKGRSCGALDFLFHSLIQEAKKQKKIFEFGTSVEQGGQILNNGLIAQKEGFGGRGIVYEEYEITLS